MYVWCSAHVLNLVLSKSFERVPKTKRFFNNIIKSIAVFFHTSTKRMAYYNEFAVMKKLPRVAETRWTYHSRTLNIINNESSHLLQLFEEMNENTEHWDGDTLSQVTSFLFNMKEFEFNLFLKTFAEILVEIFAETDILYDIIQKKTCDIAYCVKR